MTNGSSKLRERDVLLLCLDNKWRQHTFWKHASSAKTRNDDVTKPSESSPLPKVALSFYGSFLVSRVLPNVMLLL